MLSFQGTVLSPSQNPGYPVPAFVYVCPRVCLFHPIPSLVRSRKYNAHTLGLTQTHSVAENPWVSGPPAFISQVCASTPVFMCSWGWSQASLHARQAFYRLSYIPSSQIEKISKKSLIIQLNERRQEKWAFYSTQFCFFKTENVILKIICWFKSFI